MKIHPTAIIHPEAYIEPNVTIGAYVVVDKDVHIGQGTKIYPHVYLEGETVIDENCQIYSGAVIGTPPQHSRYKDEKTKVYIGAECIIREYVTIHRATAVGGTTKIGKRCYLMANSHVAHDCTLGDEVIMANSAALGGHVEVENYAVLGGLVAVHQFVRIGELSILGGGAIVTKDVPPYTCAVGNRAVLHGLNLVGLKRHGCSIDTLRYLKFAYRLIFRSGLTTIDAINQIEDKIPHEKMVTHFIDFIKNTQRGFCRE